MQECDRDGPARRSTVDGGDDFVVGASADDVSIRSRDHGSAIRMAGLVVLLSGIFVGMAWFLEVTLRAPAYGKTPVLAVIATPSAGEVGSPAGAPATTAGTENPATCAMSYPAPAHLAQFLSSGPQETPAPPAAAGTIDVRLRHELPGGRLIVSLNDRTVLSRPLTLAGGGAGTVAQRLSVPSGRHAVRVEILGTRDELLAGGTIIARVDPDRTVRLDVEHAAGMPHTITLKLSTDDEAGTRASHERRWRSGS